MQITKLRLKNFGRHEKLEANDIKAVTGLVGVNGSGKSTVLTALEFAITGSLPDKAESYVRQADGVSNAEVYIEFTKDGSQGTILRQVGKTAKRVLTWGGKTYNKAKDVDALMAEILGADKAAISNAIFINQGSLADLLFGTPGERQELFTRLLGIGYIEQRVGYLDGKIKVLSGGLQDFTALKDELIASQLAADKNVSDLKLLLSKSRDWSPQVQIWSTFSQACNDTSDAAANLQVRQRDLSTAGAGYESYLNALSKAVTAEMAGVDIRDSSSRSAVIDTLKNSLYEKKEILSQDSISRANNSNTRTLLEAKETAKAEYAEAERKLQAVRTITGGSIAELTAQIAKLEQDLEQYQNYQKNAAVLQAARDDYQVKVEACNKLKVNPVKPVSEEELKIIDDNINTLRAEANLKETRLNILKAVSDNTSTTETDVCPVCNSKLTALLSVTADTIAELEAEKAELYSKVNVLDKDKTDRQWEYKQYSTKLEGAKAAVTEASARVLKAMEAAGDEVSVPDAAQLPILRQKKQDLHNAEQQLEYACIRLEKAEAAADNVKMLPVKSELEVTQLQGQIDGLSGVIQECTEAHTTLSSLENNLQTQRTRLSSAEEAMETACAKLSRLSEECTKDPWIVEVLGSDQAPDGASLEDKELRDLIKAKLAEKQTAWNELMGRMSEATRSLGDAKTRLDDLNTRIAKDKDQREIIEKLQTVRKALTKDAVPASYLCYKFEQLLSLTQDQLSTLDANFTVDLDPDNPLTFVFSRLDEEDSGWLPQSKLSGGQRVRLTVAFLLAVQRLIIPEVGFLVLDEPSQHVDDAGVESLKDLLSSLGETLGHMEAQVWVCDHKPELTMAYGSTITLK